MSKKGVTRQKKKLELTLVSPLLFLQQSIRPQSWEKEAGRRGKEWRLGKGMGKSTD